jgi:hypothetical protein
MTQKKSIFFASGLRGRLRILSPTGKPQGTAEEMALRDRTSLRAAALSTEGRKPKSAARAGLNHRSKLFESEAPPVSCFRAALHVLRIFESEAPPVSMTED